MHDANNNKLNAAFLSLLRPLARLFLRYGRGYREYSELSKSAFVSVASKDYGVHGRPTNVSRIAAMTGMTRKEISRVREKIECGDAAVTERRTPIQEVIDAWQANEEFLDEKGRPAVLPLTGERGSFQSLLRQYAGDIPAGAMRKELQRVGAAELVGESLRFCPASNGRLQREKIMASQLRAGPFPLLAAMAKNETVSQDEDSWPQETVSCRTIRKSDVSRVRKLVSVRLRAATTNIADLLEAYSTMQNGDGADEPLVAVSAGVYYTEGIDVTD